MYVLIYKIRSSTFIQHHQATRLFSPMHGGADCRTEKRFPVHQHIYIYRCIDVHVLPTCKVIVLVYVRKNDTYRVLWNSVINERCLFNRQGTICTGASFCNAAIVSVMVPVLRSCPREYEGQGLRSSPEGRKTVAKPKHQSSVSNSVLHLSSSPFQKLPHLSDVLPAVRWKFPNFLGVDCTVI